VGDVRDIWLAVLDRAPTPVAIRAFWNNKENDVLDVLPQGSRMWLGCTRAGESPLPGPAGAVADLLFLEGTVPDYMAPVVTQDLVDRVMAAFSSAKDSSLPATDPESLRTFLGAHEGRFLLFEG
jgi:hypothetical protein